MNKKMHLYKRPPKENISVKVTKKLLDNSSTNKIGAQTPTYIVIHEVSLGTGRSPQNFNMKRYADKIIADGKSGSTIGYHYLVGDEEIYQFIEDDIATCHTGTEFGNHNSIGIERLICEGVNYEYATHNQAKLIATLMLKHNIPLENVITHKEIQRRFGTTEQQKNPKQCPGRMLAGFRGNVQDFKNEIKRCLIYGWLFEELLDDKTKENIPRIQKIAEKKFKHDKEKLKTIHNLEGLNEFIK